ncbi:MAG: hypothetical protein COY38_02220 [Candidatus Aenigmarchaeota archaeon CG_4_10_14_0_8_um_filter_37_24]|nr:MAG: hypothetical protein AUJ50_02805 [Candidatus Aenigmarchaeota archaeon CG1_02_38_14]PIX50639.1 MAG: hypothetical protein COZ52_03075 [Candidatus Aenigmarchaeota archaeon CG_4_8_14_3_um_filter_37_24]PIZ35542.1 MAG: hypothetical protein COY38_02220 [Candidatus Aenigmarchaeota archaeon CG_4_10_14_0_8_um_filter_37_24]
MYMGRIRDWIYTLDAGLGTLSQGVNLGGYIATEGLRDPYTLAREGYQFGNNAYQLYGNLRRNGGIQGIADDPGLYSTRAILGNTINGVTSAADLARVPERFRQIREENKNDPSRLRRGLRYASLGAGVVSDALNVAEAGLRLGRRVEIDI